MPDVDFPTFVAHHAATPADPVEVAITVEGSDPTTGQIRGISLQQGGRQWTAQVADLTASARHALYEYLTRVPIITADAAQLYAWVFGAWGIKLGIVGDAHLAELFLRGAGLGYLAARGITAMMRTLLDRAWLAAYTLDLHAATFLSGQSVLGYRRGDEVLHPTWTSIHPSGSPRLTASRPALQAAPPVERQQFATPFRRWYSIRWPNIGFEVLSRRTNAAYFTRLAHDPHAYETLAAQWHTSEPMARTIWYELLKYGPDPPRVAEALKLTATDAETLVGTVAAAAPEWTQWASGLAWQQQDRGYIESYFRRPLTQPTNLTMWDVQATEATLLKSLLLQLARTAGQRAHDLFAGFGSVIPLYSQITYHVDSHIPVRDHVEAAKSIGELMAGVHTEIWAGSTWGTQVRVDDDALAETRLSLMQPATYSEPCPACDRSAPDLPTLREHLVDAHQWDPTSAAAYAGPEPS